MKTAVKDVMTTRVVWVKKGATQPVPAGCTVAMLPRRQRRGAGVIS